MTRLEATVMQWICVIMGWMFLFLNASWLGLGFLLLSLGFGGFSVWRRFHDRPN